MASKKPPVPPPKPAAKPKKEPSVVEMSLDDIAEKPTTVIGVPAIKLPEGFKIDEAKPITTEKIEVVAPKKETTKTVKLPAVKQEDLATRKIDAVLAPKEEIKTLFGMPAVTADTKDEEEKPTIDSEPPVLPRSNPIRAILDGPKARLYVFAGIGGLILLIFLGVIIKAIASPSNDTTTSAASVSASQAPVVSSVPVATNTPAPPPKPIACSLSGDAHVIAPRAIVSSGVEITVRDSTFGLGFATGPKEATILELGSSMTATNVHKIAATDAIKRVTSIASDKAAIDVDSNSDAIKGRRSVGARDVGAKNGDLVWAPHGTNDTKTLWKLDADGPVESIRGTAFPDGVAIAYKQSGAIRMGIAKGPLLEISMPPVSVAGLGPQIGSPAIAANGENVLVAWADRADKDSPWSLRYFIWHSGSAPNARSFDLPGGGPGEHAMAPSVASLGNGSFLLVWTEGPMSKQQVRAQVIGESGAPSGSAITVSSPGVHAGQGRAAVLPDGHGVIAFLSAVGNPFELRAIAIQCN